MDRSSGNNLQRGADQSSADSDTWAKSIKFFPRNPWLFFRNSCIQRTPSSIFVRCPEAGFTKNELNELNFFSSFNENKLKFFIRNFVVDGILKNEPMNRVQIENGFNRPHNPAGDMMRRLCQRPRMAPWLKPLVRIDTFSTFVPCSGSKIPFLSLT